MLGYPGYLLCTSGMTDPGSVDLGRQPISSPDESDSVMIMVVSAYAQASFFFALHLFFPSFFFCKDNIPAGPTDKARCVCRLF